MTKRTSDDTDCEWICEWCSEQPQTNFEMLRSRLDKRSLANFLVYNPFLNNCLLCSERPNVDHANEQMCSEKCIDRMVEWLDGPIDQKHVNAILNGDSDNDPELFVSRREECPD